MRILYICRLYSGFEQSLKTGTWSPKGAPTIARMIEHLDASSAHDLTLVMTDKDFGSTWDKPHDEALSITGLNTSIHVLAGKTALPRWLGILREKCSDLRQIGQMIKLYRRAKPDLIFCDRVNIFPAALFARLTGTPVIWRIMGILEGMHDTAQSNRLRARFIRFLYNSPFRAALCTLDGSGGGPWMDAVLNAKTDKHLLLNGFDNTMVSDEFMTFSADQTRVLFVGRLEHLKGAFEFIQTMIDVVRQNPNFHAVIAGDGSLRTEMETMIAAENLSAHFTFLGAISPARLQYVRRNCAIYVSLNKQGNLSNVNLEALADGVFTVIPASQPQNGIDIDTDALIPDDVFVRFGHFEDLVAFKAAILNAADAKYRAPFKANAKKLAAQILPSWPKRIEQEIQIYESCITDPQA